MHNLEFENIYKNDMAKRLICLMILHIVFEYQNYSSVPKTFENPWCNLVLTSLSALHFKLTPINSNHNAKKF